MLYGQVLQTLGGSVCQNIQVVGQPAGQLLQGSWPGQTAGTVQLQVTHSNVIVYIYVLFTFFSVLAVCLF